MAFLTFQGMVKILASGLPESVNHVSVHVSTMCPVSTARDKGLIVPGNNKTSDQWSSADKFNAVMETAPLSEIELSQYCRMKGIFPEQIQQWRLACQNANEVAEPQPCAKKTAEQRRIKELERQLSKSDAGRKEAEALLELRKKANAIWGKDKED